MDLDEMRNVDIRTVSKDTLTDVSDVKIDMDLPKAERMRCFAEKIGNPYCFKSRDNIAVKVSFADTTLSVDDRMESYLRTL